MKKLLATFALTCAFFSTPAISVQAYEPFGLYGYGLALGPSYVFRNRLPTPPYFSVYSPVYYGQQYERPYGISPFASLPEVHVPQTYIAQPRATASFVLNPHCAVESVVPQPTSVEVEAPLASTGKSVWVENPYVSVEAQIAVK